MAPQFQWLHDQFNTVMSPEVLPVAMIILLVVLAFVFGDPLGRKAQSKAMWHILYGDKDNKGN